MVRSGMLAPGYVVGLLLLIGLIVGAACGGDDATAVPQATATSVPQATATSVPQATATAVPQAPSTPTATPRPTNTPAPTVMKGPQGTLTVGFKELGPFLAHPALAGYPLTSILTSGFGEGLIEVDANGVFTPMLASEWSVAPDNQTWTFKLRKGIQFHDGFGEFTAQDVIFSLEMAGRDDSLHGIGKTLKGYFLNEAGPMKAIDNYTIQNNTGVPKVDTLRRIAVPGGAGFWVMSKKQNDDDGEGAVNTNGAGTGPYDFISESAGVFRFEAVEDHWRKTPFFAEAVWREIPEESSRVAGFQTGNLDTFYMDLDSISAVEKVSGAKLMRQEGATYEYISLYGSHYDKLGTPDQWPGYDPDTLPYVSADPDPNSAEWKRVAKIRLAMTMAIDRQGIVDSILSGEGTASWVGGWAGVRHLLPAGMEVPFDPVKAEALLKEANYDGREFDMVTSVRGVVGEEAACEAVSQMWRDIGLNVNFVKIPFSQLVEDEFGRSSKRVHCRGGSLNPDPTVGYGAYAPGHTWSRGANHPIIEKLATKALSTFDYDERLATSIKIEKFIFDNSLAFDLYAVNMVWPVGSANRQLAGPPEQGRRQEYQRPRMDRPSKVVASGELRFLQWNPLATKST